MTASENLPSIYESGEPDKSRVADGGRMMSIGYLSSVYRQYAAAAGISPLAFDMMLSGVSLPGTHPDAIAVDSKQKDTLRALNSGSTE